MKLFGVCGAVFGGLAVIAGAFAAHGLRGILPPERLAVFETAARYQMYHALALLAVSRLDSSRFSRLAGLLMIVGIGLFSGSLYAMSLWDIRWLGAVTPFGGLCFIAGWTCLAVAFLRSDVVARKV
jgi:uncharacterized membrane protein YgdD (TMEM256/DUF423 family)